MRFTGTLPTPSAEALAHSEQLAQRIRHAIQAAGGSLPFRQFMHMALYEPALGYYVAGLRKFGTGGDFVTAPEISPLFSQCVANQCAEILTALGGGDLLELGAGSGRMAADILLHLETRGCLPERYLILDVSPDLRLQQRETLQARAGHLLKRVQWLDALPAQPLRGVILGNEVLDALPVELFMLDEGVVYSMAVEMDGEGFAFVRGEFQSEDPHPNPSPRGRGAKENALLLPLYLWERGLGGEGLQPYTSEYNPVLPAWMRSMADILAAGSLLLIDYGYEQRDYYHPERSQGTLICHYQHRAHDQPLVWPGLQDITANVDFTAVAEAGCDAGLDLAGYTTQAQFLINTGLEDLFIAQLNASPDNQYRLAQQIRLLTLPAEMGERFKVIAFNKGFTAGLRGFRLCDQRHRL